MSHITDIHAPNLVAGLHYWEHIAAPDLGGVLGGYASIHRIDALSSRLFLLRLLPSLSVIKSPADQGTEAHHMGRRRALDVGAGIGRVTKTVLLPFAPVSGLPGASSDGTSCSLFDRVDIVEPVGALIQKARLDAPSWPEVSGGSRRRGIRLWQTTMQDFDPRHALKASHGDQVFHEVGATDGWQECEGYDVIWCQWQVYPTVS